MKISQKFYILFHFKPKNWVLQNEGDIVEFPFSIGQLVLIER
jgi:hypothetical protein